VPDADGGSRLERDDGVATVTIDRPAKRNALTPTMFDALIAAFGDIAADPEVRVVLISGAGGDFSAGGDIAGFGELENDAARHAQLDRAFGAFLAVEATPVPVIAAVEGIAYGGGTELALCCDLVFAAEDAQFALPELPIGLVAGFGLDRLVRRCGLGTAAWLTLLGRPLGAREAKSRGLVQEVVEPAGLHAAARAAAEHIASQPPAAVRAATELLRARMGPDRLDDARAAIVALFASDEHAAAVEQFVRRRS
jgi:enoyl-CoA hydratase/carnithine racemase